MTLTPSIVGTMAESLRRQGRLETVSRLAVTCRSWRDAVAPYAPEVRAAFVIQRVFRRRRAARIALRDDLIDMARFFKPRSGSFEMYMHYFFMTRVFSRFEALGNKPALDPDVILRREMPKPILRTLLAAAIPVPGEPTVVVDGTNPVNRSPLQIMPTMFWDLLRRFPNNDHVFVRALARVNAFLRSTDDQELIRTRLWIKALTYDVHRMCTRRKTIREVVESSLEGNDASGAHQPSSDQTKAFRTILLGSGSGPGRSEPAVPPPEPSELQSQWEWFLQYFFVCFFPEGEQRIRAPRPAPPPMARAWASEAEAASIRGR